MCKTRNISSITRSDWTFEIRPWGIVHVVDLNLGGMTVTNDAEGVIAALHREVNLEGRRVQYVDSDGQVDRLLHSEGEFTGFATGPWPIPSTLERGRNAAQFRKGDQVRYVPTHAHDDPSHPDCQDGVVSSANEKHVFVKYDCLLGKAITGDEPWTSQATRPEDLVRRSAT